MGHTINPITWRVGSLFHWNFNFYSKKLNYFYLTLKLNNLLIVILRYLKYLKRKFLRNFNFNFSFCRVCMLNKKFIILIKSKLNFRWKKRVYTNIGHFNSSYFWDFIRIYNTNWTKVEESTIKFRENIPTIVHTYFYILQIPKDYRFFYLKKLKKVFKQKRKTLKEAVEAAKALEAEEAKKGLKLKIIKKKTPLNLVRSFTNSLKKIKKLKTINYNKHLSYFFLIPKMSNKAVSARLKTRYDLEDYWDGFVLTLLRKLLVFFYIIPVINYFKKLLYWKAYQLDKKKFNTLEIYFLFDKKFFFNSYTLICFLLKRFSKRKFRIRRTINRVIRYLNYKIKMNRLKGYKLIITGRLTKKERVTCIFEKRGLIGVRKKIVRMDYYENVFLTKFSIGIMKAWLFY